MSDSLPSWIKINQYNKNSYIETKNLIDSNNINTVCIEANCPNRYECFSKKTATFMILGNICTRNCRYCNIKKGEPNPLDIDEPKRIADAVKKLGLNYIVITCVTRDDLEDGGAEHFVNTLKKIKEVNPESKIEFLISDFNGNRGSLKKIIDSKPDVLNHNIEVAKELFPNLRPKGEYNLSLELLKKSKKINPEIKTKSGFMLGLGEKQEQIIQTIKDLREVDCDIITIGQYLKPNTKNYDVQKYYSEKEFNDIKKIAEDIGIKSVVAGPLVRSSYKARELI